MSTDTIQIALDKKPSSIQHLNLGKKKTVKMWAQVCTAHYEATHYGCSYMGREQPLEMNLNQSDPCVGSDMHEIQSPRS